MESSHRRRGIHWLASLRAAHQRRQRSACLDNFFTGRRENIFHLLDNPRFELMRHDVTEPILLEVDQIYNLACPASPVHYQYNPVKTVKTSVMGADQHAWSREARARAHSAGVDFRSLWRSARPSAD
jgi:hypothetical protein